MSKFQCDHTIFADYATFLLGGPQLDCQCSNSSKQVLPIVSSSTSVANSSVTTTSGSEAIANLGVAVLLLGILIAVIA